MAKKLLFLLAFLLALPLVYASDYLGTQSLDLELKIKNSITVIPESKDYLIKSVEAKINYYPIESFRQQVASIYIIPNPKTANPITIKWENPPNKFGFEAVSNIKTKSDFLPVKEKIGFPLLNLENELYEYIQEDEIIDITPEIRDLASSIAGSRDDLFSVVFELGKWAEQNIEYNLSSANVEASQKASWVLENKQGVCDEITSLFIAMCRSLGIPARFISGIAYTNSEHFSNKWGPHGWAEVFFPGTGWVPFDVTYGELGYINAGHIKLSQTTGPKSSSVEYEYVGRGISLDVGKLDFDTMVLSVGESIEKVVGLEVSVYSSEIGFGSHNMVTAKVKNLKDYYVTQKVFIGKTQGTTILDEYQKFLLLKPYEEKAVNWIIKVDEGLDPRSIYTFPVKVYTNRNQEVAAEFKVRAGYKEISYGELAVFSIDDDITGQDISLFCEPEKYEIYYYEKSKINCVLEKKGSAAINNIDVCLDGRCDSYNIKGINRVEFGFEKEFDGFGLKNIPITAKYEKNSKTNYVIINVVDEPELYISEIKTPKEVRFDDNFSIDFTLKRKSQSYPKNIFIKLGHDKDILRYSWSYDLLKNNQQFLLNTEGKMLGIGGNKFVLDITFEGEDGKKYNQSEQFSIILKDTTIGEKIFIFLNRAGIGIERILTNKEDRLKFFKSPKTWIAAGILVIIFMLLELLLFFERKKGRYIPRPGIPKR